MRKMRILFLVLPFFVISEAFSYELGKVDIHGFISQGYMKGYYYEYIAGMTDGTFNFNEIGINFNTKPSPNLRIGVQFFSRNIGELGSDDILIDWAVADYYVCKTIGLRVGRIKSPIGLYNETRDVDVLRTGIFLNQSIYNELYRDSILAIDGFGFYGEIGCPMLGTVNYQAQIGSLNIDVDGGTAQGIIGITNIDVIEEIDYKWATNLGIKWMPPFPGLVLSFTDSRYKMVITGWIETLYGEMTYDPSELLVYSVEYARNNFVFVYEYSRLNIDYFAEAQNIDFSRKGFQRVLGWYSGISYRFLPWLEGAVAYSEFYDRAYDMKGRTRSKDYKAWQKDVTVSFRFDIRENWVLKMEDHMIGGNNQVPSQNGGNYNVEHWNYWAVKVSFIF